MGPKPTESSEAFAFSAADSRPDGWLEEQFAAEDLHTLSTTINLNPGKARPERSRRAEPSLTGTLLGEYELLEIVGRGGMGVVYKARHRTLQRIVALKVIREDRQLSLDTAKRFHQEVAAVAKLDHPHIVPIYEVGEMAGQQFYSMAFVEGTSLAQLVALSPLAPQRAAKMMQTVAAAIAYAHAQGVVHRDLKPENILVDAEDRPRITDFGTAQCADADSRVTLAGEIIGTPSYMSPEQAEGTPRKIGAQSDVYSLGATLYCLVTGRPPFQAATPLDTLNQLVEREPVSPRQLNPAVDRDLETICLKCLEKAPERRYASASALADDLQRFIERRPILARPVSPLEKATRWCRRNPFVFGLLASLVGVFFTAFALVSWSYLRAEEALQEEARQRALAKEALDDARTHENAERWERYRANMIAASSAFQAQNISVAKLAIEAAPGMHRNWEWRHFSHQIDQSNKTLSTGASVGLLRFAGGHRLIVHDTGLTGTLSSWDLTTGRRLRVFSDIRKLNWCVDPTGRLFAYPSKDNTVVIWDLDADRQYTLLRGGSGQLAFCTFSPDGKLLAACTGQSRGLLWEVATGKLLKTWDFLDEHTGEVIGFEISNRQLAVRRTKCGHADIWDLHTGQKLHTLAGHKEHVVRAEFNRQGTRIVTSEGYPSNIVRMWNAETGQQLAVLRGHTNLAQDMRFSPDGKVLATCSFDQTIRLWDGLTGAPIATMQGHAGRVLAISFSPDSKRLASGSQDHAVRLWNATNGDLIAVLHGHAGVVNSVEFSADGATIASGSTDHTIRLWDARLAERNGVLRGHTSFVYSVAFHPDGERLVSAAWDGTIRLSNATSGHELACMRTPNKKSIINSIAMHPGGDLVASIGRDDAVHLWDLRTAQHVHQWSVPSDHWQDTRVAFSPQGDLVAAGSMDSAVYVWDVHSRERWAVLRGHTDHVHDVAFSPDGRWLASASAEADRSIRVWDVARKEVAHILAGHRDSVLALAFSANGSLLASGSNDGSVRLWNTTTWTESATLKHGTTVYAVAFTPDGSRLATGCADNSIRVWDVASGQEVTELRSHGSYIKSLTFSPDGTRLASASGDFTVRVWDTLSARERVKEPRTK